MGIKFGLIDGCFVAGGCSLDFPGLNDDKDEEIVVRAHHYPGCIVVRPIPGGSKRVCTVQWLLESDYGGWVPSCVVNRALPFSQIMTLQSMKEAIEAMETSTKR